MVERLKTFGLLTGHSALIAADYFEDCGVIATPSALRAGIYSPSPAYPDGDGNGYGNGYGYGNGDGNGDGNGYGYGNGYGNGYGYGNGDGYGYGDG